MTTRLLCAIVTYGGLITVVRRLALRSRPAQWPGRRLEKGCKMSFFNRAAATANRLMRTQQVDMSIASLREQQRKLASEIGSKVLEMYHAGKAADPDLLPSLQSWDGLEQQIDQKENEKKAIEAEATAAAQPRPQPAPAASAMPAAATTPVAQAFGHLCSKERIPVPAGAAFCPNCGAPAIDVTAPVAAAAQATTVACSKCGATIPVGAAFCPECGTAQARPAA